MVQGESSLAHRFKNMFKNNFEKTIYLSKFDKLKKTKIAYVPIGTLEWHGNHLPIETDYLVATKICEIISKKIPGYVLPPIYLGSGTKKKVEGKWLVGMDKYLKKELPGNLYYLDPGFFSKLLTKLTGNLKKQGFKKIFIITGHSGKGQIKALTLAKTKSKNLFIINPYDILEKNKKAVGHADENETSLFWACFPEEMKKSLGVKINKKDDFFVYQGYDPRKKASINLGKQLLLKIVNKINIDIKKAIR